MRTFKFMPEIRIGETWLMPAFGDGFESFEAAESFAKWAAKCWLESGVESRVAKSAESLDMVRLAQSRYPELMALLICVKHEKKSRRAKKTPQVLNNAESECDEIDRAEMDREYRENIWRNHDCDPEPESFERGMTLEEALQYRYEREMESQS